MKLKSNIITYILLLLYITVPFVQILDEEMAAFFKVNRRLLPTFVSSFASIYRYLCFFIFACVFLFYGHLKAINRLSFLKDLWIFYFIQMLYSLVTLTEVDRFVLLFFLSIIIPSVAMECIVSYGIYKFISQLKVITFFLVAFSLLWDIETVVSGGRFMGFLNNPNLFAVVGILWLSILLIDQDTIKIKSLNTISILLIMALIFLSGSRTGFITAIFILVFVFIKKRNFLLLFVTVGIVLITTLGIFLQSHIQRFANLGDKEKDSGRLELWDLTLQKLPDSWVLGTGFNGGLEILGTSNFHNNYLNYAFHMGIPLAFITIIAYFLFMRTSYGYLKYGVSRSLIAFLLGYAILNFGEDLFIGVGSVTFIYQNIILGIMASQIMMRGQDRKEEISLTLNAHQWLED